MVILLCAEGGRVEER